MPSRPRAFLALTVLLAAFALACDSGSTLEIRAQASLTDPAGLAGLEMDVAGLTVTASELRAGGGRVELRVPDRGTLPVRVRLFQGDELVAGGELTLEMADDWEWGMDVFRRVENPALGCFGCRGDVGFPIAEGAAAAPGEAVWVTWGGDERDSDVIY
jgi:hypothetical protein